HPRSLALSRATGKKTLRCPYPYTRHCNPRAPHCTPPSRGTATRRSLFSPSPRASRKEPFQARGLFVSQGPSRRVPDLPVLGAPLGGSQWGTLLGHSGWRLEQQTPTRRASPTEESARGTWRLSADKGDALAASHGQSACLHNRPLRPVVGNPQVPKLQSLNWLT